MKKIALVTGASRGIGQAIAARLAQHYTVIGTATSQKGADAITERLRAYSEDNQGVVLRIDEADSITDTVKALQDQYGQIDLLINNAGITRDGLLMRMKDDDWEAVLNTNLMGVFRLTKACMRSMMKQRFGRIVNIASVVGVMGNAGQANYAAAKAGLIGFTKSVAKELGSRNITANVIAPGFIQTDMTDSLDEKTQAELLKQIPLDKLGQVEDVAYAVEYLVSEGAGYVTGQTLHINGGLLMP